LFDVFIGPNEPSHSDCTDIELDDEPEIAVTDNAGQIHELDDDESGDERHISSTTPAIAESVPSGRIVQYSFSALIVVKAVLHILPINEIFNYLLLVVA